ncbi:hypothetical protein RKD49_006856 [Streptomyces glaucescens]
MPEDRLVLGAHLGARIHAQLVGEAGAQPLVGGQGLALPARQVQGAQMGGVQAFAERVVGEQGAQFTGQRVVLAEVEAGLRVRLQRGHPLVLEPDDRRAREVLVRHVGVGGPPPQAQRVRQQGRPVPGAVGLAGTGGQRAERARVDRVGGDGEQIAGRLPDDQVPAAGLARLQRAAQLGDAGLQRGGRVAGEPVTPQALDQPVGRHRPALGEQQVCEQRPHLRLRYMHRQAVLRPHGQRAEHPETHA